MTVNIKLKVLIKIRASEMICVELRAKKCIFTLDVCICDMFFLTCTEHTSTMLPVNEIQDYDY